MWGWRSAEARTRRFGGDEGDAKPWSSSSDRISVVPCCRCATVANCAWRAGEGCRGRRTPGLAKKLTDGPRTPDAGSQRCYERRFSANWVGCARSGSEPLRKSPCGDGGITRLRTQKVSVRAVRGGRGMGVRCGANRERRLVLGCQRLQEVVVGGRGSVERVVFTAKLGRGCSRAWPSHKRRRGQLSLCG